MLLLTAVIAAPLGLTIARIVPVLFWSWTAGLVGIIVSVICVAGMALARCPRCHALLGIAEAAREFQSHRCPFCGVDLRSRI
jgi:hypothetical protein